MPDAKHAHANLMVVDESSDSDDEVNVSLNENKKEEPIKPKVENVTNVVDVTASHQNSKKSSKSVVNETTEAADDVKSKTSKTSKKKDAEDDVKSKISKTSKTSKKLSKDSSTNSFNKTPSGNKIIASTPKKSPKQKTEEKSPKPKGPQPKYFIPKKEPRDKKPIKSEITQSSDTANTTTIVWSDSDDDEKSSRKSRPSTPDPDDRFGPKSRRKFRPRLYDFVLEDYEGIRDTMIVNERKFDDNFIIRCPEFAILLDHAIAVIWFFYRDWKNWNIFNVPQLEWAIKFLDGIVSNIEIPHVEIIKKQLQELLFIIYTEVPRHAVDIPEPKPLPRTKKLERDLPVSLNAMLQQAPGFKKYLSTTSTTKCANTERKTSQLDTYVTARLQLMKNELAKLGAYERRYEESPNRDAELTQIINNIKLHADELVRVREQLENHF